MDQATIIVRVTMKELTWCTLWTWRGNFGNSLYPALTISHTIYWLEIYERERAAETTRQRCMHSGHSAHCLYAFFKKHISNQMAQLRLYVPNFWEEVIHIANAVKNTGTSCESLYETTCEFYIISIMCRITMKLK